MTENMMQELADLTERAQHQDTMRFSAEDAERLAYLEAALEVYRDERDMLRRDR